MDNFLDRRKDERKPIIMDTRYKMINGSIESCHVNDISLGGLCIKTKGFLGIGEIIKVIFDDSHIIPSIVVRHSGELAGIKFDSISEENFSYLQQINRSYLQGDI